MSKMTKFTINLFFEEEGQDILQILEQDFGEFSVDYMKQILN